MKAIYKVLTVAALAAPLFSSCIEEALPTNQVTQGQLNSNPGATDALVQGMPARMNQITVSTSAHYDGGYSSILHIRDVMTEDMSVEYAGGFDWYASWSGNDGTSDRWLTTQMIWNYHFEQILTTNMVIGAIDKETEIPALQANLGKAYAFRAFIYLDAARMYEFLPNEMFPDSKNTEGNSVLGLTIPKVTDETSEADYTNNPRLTHAEMVEFILDDLSKAEALLLNNPIQDASKTVPSIGVVYGLMARTHLWDASYKAEIDNDATAAAAAYDRAAEFARKAITYSGATPLTQEQWLDTTRGFNDESFSAWMFAGKYSAEDDVVTAGGIRTFSSFCCHEEEFGYSAPEQGAYTMINANMYKRISDRDFRKLSWFAPDGSPLRGKEHFLDKDFAEQNFYEYVSLKFRPGQGNMTDYNVGAVVAYPLMRVEEMYFIEAEATAHNNPAAGNDLLKNFMKTYRYDAYTNPYTTEKDVVEEIIFQKRVELWGEGQAFFDVKRLNYSVTRWYDGTNFTPGLNTFNTNGRPAWMNIVITRQETSNNAALASFNSPSPEGLYTPIK